MGAYSATSAAIQTALDTGALLLEGGQEAKEIERITAEARGEVDAARALVLSEYGTRGADLYTLLGSLAHWLQELARRTIESGAIIRTVTTRSTMPATILAMLHLGDPQRAEDVIRLNRPTDPNRLPPGEWRIPNE